MATASIHGRTEIATKVNGTKVSSMAKEQTSMLMVTNSQENTHLANPMDTETTGGRMVQTILDNFHMV